MSSLDTNQPIYITEKSREDLFEYILREEKDCENMEQLYKYMFSSENLEQYCFGATERADYAYKKISKQLRKEYDEWIKNKEPQNEINDKVWKDKNGLVLKVGDKVKYISYDYNISNRTYNAEIESFAKETAKIKFIGSKNVKWVKPQTYLEKITDDTIEDLRFTRQELKRILELIEKENKQEDKEIKDRIYKKIGWR